ncbi:MAG: response regulator transcription factor [Chloroflexi bacterium]|nr:response regulator transcription factor [Chloroflexota bacterium]
MTSTIASSSSEPCRVLIVDDHQIVREGLRLILETEPSIEVVGEASDGAEAVELAATLDPAVILMDLRMPGMDGLTAIEHLQRDHPQIAVVILTTYNEDELMLRGLRSGAKGYLLKDTGRQTLLDTIAAATRGETLLTADIISRILIHTSGPAASPKPSGSLDLTEREQQVLEAAALGERNKEIAARLGITERTVKAHLTSIYNKFGVDSRAAAIAVAAQRGLLPPMDTAW